MNSFRTTIFDPALVIGQMLWLQTVFYCSETFLMFLWSFNGYCPSLDDIFSLQVIWVINMYKEYDFNFIPFFTW